MCSEMVCDVTWEYWRNRGTGDKNGDGGLWPVKDQTVKRGVACKSNTSVFAGTAGTSTESWVENTDEDEY